MLTKNNNFQSFKTIIYVKFLLKELINIILNFKIFLTGNKISYKVRIRNVIRDKKF